MIKQDATVLCCKGTNKSVNEKYCGSTLANTDLQRLCRREMRSSFHSRECYQGQRVESSNDVTILNIHAPVKASKHRKSRKQT